jgi:glutathione S-transferase
VGDITVAESGAILEYLVERYDDDGRLAPAVGTPERLRWRYWMHFAEGSAMPPLLIKLICEKVARSPMPFSPDPSRAQFQSSGDSRQNNRNASGLLESELTTTSGSPAAISVPPTSR